MSENDLHNVILRIGYYTSNYNLAMEGISWDKGYPESEFTLTMNFPEQYPKTVLISTFIKCYMPLNGSSQMVLENRQAGFSS